MATKTKAAKTVSTEPAPAKSGAAKTKKVLGATHEQPVETPKPAKGVSKTKPQALPDSPPPAQKNIAKPVKKPAAKESTTLEQTAPLTAPSETLNHKWQEIRTILEKLKEDTLREIRKSVKNGTEALAAIEPGGDIYDQASSERDRELGLLLGDREREKIHSIDEALLRIDEGEYGICEECDEDIPLGRLKAMPFTRHCVKCKSDLEKLQAQTKRVEEDRAYREIPLGSEEEE